MEKTIIDVNFDFTNDTPKFWDNYWQDEMGKSPVDPDSYSPTLKTYHRLLWSKRLPNGEYMELKDGGVKGYLVWKNFRFGSDSITASFRYNNYKYMIKNVMTHIDDYKNYIEYYTRKSYTIGGEIIFPKKSGSINQIRGCNHSIKDRFDLTLECIRKYYKNESSPLYETLLDNKDFFDLFVDFKNYVDYFYLQDLVSNDYKKVNMWLENGEFHINPLPKTVDEYLIYMDNQLSFVEKRNNRINKEINDI